MAATPRPLTSALAQELLAMGFVRSSADNTVMLNPDGSMVAASALNAQDVAAQQSALKNVFLNGVSTAFLQAIFERVLAGETVFLEIVGDSTTAGQGGGTSGGQDGARPFSYASQMAAALTAAGIPTYNASVIGTQRVTNPVLYDTRISTSFSNTNLGSGGGNSWRGTGPGLPFYVTPGCAYDTVTALFVANTNGSATCKVGADATTRQTLTGRAANDLQKVTFTVPRVSAADSILAAGQFKIDTTSTAGTDFYVIALIFSDSTKGGLHLLQSGAAGAVMAGFAGAGSTWQMSTPTYRAAIGSAAVILQATINDTGNTTPAAYRASLDTFANACAVAGQPLILMTGIPSNTATKTLADAAAINAQVMDRAATSKHILIDMYSTLGSYAVQNAPPYERMADDLHGNKRMYAWEGGRYLPNALRALASLA